MRRGTAELAVITAAMTWLQQHQLLFLPTAVALLPASCWSDQHTTPLCAGHGRKGNELTTQQGLAAG